MTAWVDPQIQLWNRSLLDNLAYGVDEPAGTLAGPWLEQADLLALLEKLPQGLQTVLGESGALVSGGEGQRVRLGRALRRPAVRLVILDEPFRGLDRASRRRLLARTRQHWEAATLLCITHDIKETQIFDRVLVIDNGQIVEDGTPCALATQPGSRYRSLLEADRRVQARLWASAAWRRLRIEHGQLVEDRD
jgi:ATP-binding cassette subfamily B protein